MLYFIVCILSDRPEQTVQTKMRRRKRGVSSGSTLFATHPAILDTAASSKLDLFKFYIKYGKEMRCLNIKGKYSKVTNTEIKLSIIIKSVMMVIFCGIYRSINRLFD